MNRAFIEEIIAKIKADLPEFKKVGIFNDDFNKHENGTGNQVNFPAIFLSFPDEVNYINKTLGLQETEEFVIRLNIGMKFMTDADLLNIFDLKQKVYTIFHKFQPENCSSMYRISESTDEDRNGFYIFEQDYEVRLIDKCANIYRDGSLQEIGLDLTADLIRVQPLDPPFIPVDPPVDDSTLFKTEWTTTTSSENITIPLVAGETYDFNYRLNGGTWVNHTSDTLIIVADINGVNQIDFNPKGTGLPSWSQNNAGDKLKITKISQFGTNVWQDLTGIFYGCSNLVFIAIDEMNTSQVTSLISAFRDCPGAIDVDISSWDISNVTNATSFMLGAGTTTAIYDAFLINADSLTVQSGVSWDFGSSKYTLGGPGETARESLISIDSWTITDGGSTNAVVNGDFINGDLTGWTLKFGASNETTGVGDFARVQSGGSSTLALEQIVTDLTIGDNYKFEFTRYALQSKVSINGAGSFSTIIDTTTVPQIHTFTATSTSLTIRISANTTNQIFEIDRVYLVKL